MAYAPGVFQILGVPWDEAVISNVAVVGSGALESGYSEYSLEAYVKPGSSNSNMGGVASLDVFASGTPSSAIDWDAAVARPGHVGESAGVKVRFSSSGDWVGSDGDYTPSGIETAQTNIGSGIRRPDIFAISGGRLMLVAEYWGSSPDTVSHKIRAADPADWTVSDTPWSALSTIYTPDEELVEGDAGTTGGLQASPRGIWRWDTDTIVIASLQHKVELATTRCYIRLDVSSDDGATWSTYKKAGLVSVSIGTKVHSILAFSWDQLSGEYSLLIKADDGSTPDLLYYTSVDYGQSWRLVQTFTDYAGGAIESRNGMVYALLATSASVVPELKWRPAGGTTQFATHPGNSRVASDVVSMSTKDIASCVDELGRVSFFGRDVLGSGGAADSVSVIRLDADGNLDEPSSTLGYWSVGNTGAGGSYDSYIRTESAARVGSAFYTVGGIVSEVESTQNSAMVQRYGGLSSASDDGITWITNWLNLYYTGYGSVVVTPTDEPNDGTDGYLGATRSGTFTLTDSITDHGSNKVIRMSATSAGSQTGYYTWAGTGSKTTVVGTVRMYGDTGGSLTEDAATIRVRTRNAAGSDSYASAIRMDYDNDQARLVDVNDSSATIATTAADIGLVDRGVDFRFAQNEETVTWWYRAVGDIVWTLIGTAGETLTALGSAGGCDLSVGTITTSLSQNTEINFSMLAYNAEAAPDLSDGVDDGELLPIHLVPNWVYIFSGVSLSGRGTAQLGDAFEVNSTSKAGLKCALNTDVYPSPTRQRWQCATADNNATQDFVIDLGAGEYRDLGGELFGFVVDGMDGVTSLDIFLSSNGSSFSGMADYSVELGETLTAGWSQIGTTSFIGTAATTGRHYTLGELNNLLVEMTDDSAYTLRTRILKQTAGQWSALSGIHRMRLQMEYATKSGSWGTLSTGSGGTMTVYHSSAVIWVYAPVQPVNRYLKIVMNPFANMPMKAGTIKPLRGYLLHKQAGNGVQYSPEPLEEISVSRGIRTGLKVGDVGGTYRFPFRELVSLDRYNPTNVVSVPSFGTASQVYSDLHNNADQARGVLDMVGTRKPVVWHYGATSAIGFSSIQTYLGKRGWLWGHISDLSVTSGAGRFDEGGADGLADMDLSFTVAT